MRHGVGVGLAKQTTLNIIILGARMSVITKNSILNERSNWSFVDVMPGDFVGWPKNKSKPFGRRVRGYKFEGPAKFQPPDSIFVIFRDDDGSTLDKGWVVLSDVVEKPWKHVWA